MTLIVYFSKALKAEPKLRLADAYGNVEPDIDYLFGNDRQQQEQRPQMQPPPHIGGATTDTSRYRQQRFPSLQETVMPSLQQIAQTAQVQPALNPFPWQGESFGVSGSYSHPAIAKAGMYPQKKMFKGPSMYPRPKNF